jgi:hypothetical protein
MRLLLILVFAFACFAQSRDTQPDAVLKQLERAEQLGDFDTYLSLWTEEKSHDLEKLRPYVKARPAARYSAIKTLVQGDDAVLLAKGPSDSYLVIRLKKENSG